MNIGKKTAEVKTWQSKKLNLKSAPLFPFSLALSLSWLFFACVQVIDIDRVAKKEQRKSRKRKHVKERKRERRRAREELQALPPPTPAASVEEVTFWIATMLEEPKMHLTREWICYLSSFDE